VRVVTVGAVALTPPSSSEAARLRPGAYEARSELPALPHNRPAGDLSLVAGHVRFQGMLRPQSVPSLKTSRRRSIPVFRARPATGLLPSSLVGRVLTIAGPAVSEAEPYSTARLCSAKRACSQGRHTDTSHTCRGRWCARSALRLPGGPAATGACVLRLDKARRERAWAVGVMPALQSTRGRPPGSWPCSHQWAMLGYVASSDSYGV
jgi:hypothetical protein